ncbi:hypothetical protein GCM10010911_65830 [Paenibacillus nasutitermitis]|uniref:NlpC/P60 domain-containing protein n=2 Tax=Paenibacillus nasutitermitis TaxID=1652958 RepID=A0A916ZI17_9BACL|nr:hypothetical protein GCM10010911_65830 [Paenibacillus nasutitermitis]
MNTAEAPGQKGRTASIMVANHEVFADLPVYRESGGRLWIPLKESAGAMSLDLHNRGDRLALGNTDAAYWLKVNDSKAAAGERSISLPQAPKLFDGKPYVTTETLSALLATPVHWNEQSGQVTITPIDDRTRLALQQQAGMTLGHGQLRGLSLPADKDEIIQFAKKYIGTPYDFGSSSYSASHKFDCSSFVQHVYAHFGVDLPRTARDQAEVGQTIPQSQLQTGDLMFFYTPDRFETNRIVGHVGIYAGSGRMIQTYGDPGVVMSDFNDYWKGRFLLAKRVGG